MPKAPLFYKMTDDLRISVRPTYVEDHSKPADGQYVFSYAIRIENVGSETVQLMTRRWLIWDSIGEETVVEGEGVVGEQPVIAPGAVHEYESFCVLKSPSGWMEGHYTFLTDDDAAVEAQIPRFTLTAEGAGEPR
jgi:ApaG protein